MKKLGINLLPTATRFQLSQLRLSKKLKQIAFVSVGVWVFVVLVVFVVRVTVNRRIGTLVKEEREIKLILEEVSPQMSLQQSLRFRLKLAAEVISERPLLAEKMIRTVSLLPVGASIRTISFRGKNSEIIGEVSSLSDLAEFEHLLISASREKLYRKINIRSLGSNNGKWGFLVEISESS